MAFGTRATNTFAEVLRKAHSLLSEGELTDDADLDFIAKLKGAIQEYSRGSIESIAQQGLTQAPPSGPAQGPPPGLGMPMQPGMGGPPPGVSAGMSMSPDEIARIISGGDM